MIRQQGNKGFTLIEVLVAIAVTLIIMASVFGVLLGGQDSFRRENQVADMQMSTRSGLDMIGRDLTLAGYKTPPASAVIWSDGGGIQPDEVTIVYADPNIPISRPKQCGAGGKGGGGGPCGTIGRSSTLLLDPDTFDPMPGVVEESYEYGMMLTAIETADCNGDGQVGLTHFHLTQDPQMTTAGGEPTVQINHNPGNIDSELNVPGGFNHEVKEDCAVVGMFRVITYRVSPPPPVGNPTLERRDLGDPAGWIAVAHNIENLQIRYGIGNDGLNLFDVPPVAPSDDPLTWINRVDVTLTGRTEEQNLKGATAGAFDPNEIYVRKTVSSQVGLRNVVNEAENRATAF
ncbi:MAG TPA: prepilin-type N-terminal cleavage/methylation domain-containing protein [Vicinamibacteria bacterium]|nr:prepilin-type N-terminal cleavage/methylation domain-containing protein [Vicinamibacteria bacterium]